MLGEPMRIGMIGPQIKKIYIYYCLPIIISFGIGQLKESDFGAETK